MHRTTFDDVNMGLVFLRTTRVKTSNVTTVKLPRPWPICTLSVPPSDVLSHLFFDTSFGPFTFGSF